MSAKLVSPTPGLHTDTGTPRILFILNVLHLSFTLASVRPVHHTTDSCRALTTAPDPGPSEWHDDCPVYHPVGDLLVCSSRLPPATAMHAVNLEFSLISGTYSLTDVLVCRFLLDLQEASRQDVRFDGDDVQPSSFSSGASVGSVMFARVLGSIGSTIVPSVFVTGDAQDGCTYAEF